MESQENLTAEFAAEIAQNKAMLDDAHEDKCPVHEIELTEGFCEFCQVCYTCK